MSGIANLSGEGSAKVLIQAGLIDLSVGRWQEFEKVDRGESIRDPVIRQ